MNIVYLGPPGAGKGTMASRTHEIFKVPHISTGDLFRDNVGKKTDLGLQVKEILDRGDLVPDEITLAMVKIRLAEKDAEKGFVLDGFPRTIVQAESLSEFKKIDYAINLICSREELIKRLTGRRSCPKCKRIYHIIFMPPMQSETCDDDGSTLIVREDDSLVSVENRLNVYDKLTAPLVDWYAKQGLICNIAADVSPDQVFGAIKTILLGKSKTG